MPASSEWFALADRLASRAGADDEFHHLSSISSTIRGLCQSIASNTRAGPSGVRRPCSQLRKVPRDTPIWRENAACDSPVLRRTADTLTTRSGQLERSSGAPRPSFGATSPAAGMADFTLWATACETALWPAGTFARAYAANRTASIEGIIDADPVAARVRELMTERSSWTGTAADLLRISLNGSGDRISRSNAEWPKNARALAGYLRRAQTFLRTLGIDIAFTREGRAGTRVIRMRTSLEHIVSTVSSVRENGSGSIRERSPPGPFG